MKTPERSRRIPALRAGLALYIYCRRLVYLGEETYRPSEDGLLLRAGAEERCTEDLALGKPQKHSLTNIKAQRGLQSHPCCLIYSPQRNGQQCDVKPGQRLISRWMKIMQNESICYKLKLVDVQAERVVFVRKSTPGLHGTPYAQTAVTAGSR